MTQQNELAISTALVAPGGSVERYALLDDLDQNDPFVKAALRLAAFADVLDNFEGSEQARRTRQRVGAAADMLRAASSSRGSRERVTEDEKAVFLVGIASGLTTTQAAELVPTVNRNTWYYLRKNDPEFDARWDDALDCRSEPVLARMADIAIYGAEDSNATIRAADLVIRNTSRRQRDDLRRHADLQYSGRLKVRLEIELNTPTPD